MLALSTAVLAGCDDSTGVDTTTNLSILMTDAPADYIAEAMVDIGAVELIGGAGGPVTLSADGTAGPVNLLELQNAATAALATAEIEAGSYTQLRLVVESASVTLDSGYVFTDSTVTKDLTVPSGAQTGIKLNLSAGDAEGTAGSVDIEPGTMVLVVDFDVNQSFVLQGAPGTPGISGVTFQPTLRVVVNDVAGTISGTASTGLAGVTIDGLVVTATPIDGTTLEPFQTIEATALTDANGDYMIHYLVPGDYEVSIDAGTGLIANVDTVTVGEAEAVADVDFVLITG